MLTLHVLLNAFNQCVHSLVRSFIHSFIPIEKYLCSIKIDISFISPSRRKTMCGTGNDGGM